MTLALGAPFQLPGYGRSSTRLYVIRACHCAKVALRQPRDACEHGRVAWELVSGGQVTLICLAPGCHTKVTIASYDPDEHTGPALRCKRHR